MIAPNAGDLKSGEVFVGRFRVSHILARGGMGTVYEVEQIETSQRRALKVMRPEFVTDARNRERFRKEATAGSLIESEHVVQVIDAGVDEVSGFPWLVMEYLDGHTLEAHLTTCGHVEPAEVCEILEQLCHALALAHSKGIVHRDLKPENMFIARSRQTGRASIVKVLDFGIAKWLTEFNKPETATAAMGTPLYMAPEQTDPKGHIGPETDVWALGLLTFQLLTGKRYRLAGNSIPFNVNAFVFEMAGQPIVAASLRANEVAPEIRLPAGFDEWFARCVSKTAAARFANAGAAFSDLAPVLRSGDGRIGPLRVLGASESIDAPGARAPREAPHLRGAIPDGLLPAAHVRPADGAADPVDVFGPTPPAVIDAAEPDVHVAIDEGPNRVRPDARADAVVEAVPAARRRADDRGLRNALSAWLRKNRVTALALAGVPILVVLIVLIRVEYQPPHQYPAERPASRVQHPAPMPAPILPSRPTPADPITPQVTRDAPVVDSPRAPIAVPGIEACRRYSGFDYVPEGPQRLVPRSSRHHAQPVPIVAAFCIQHTEVTAGQYGGCTRCSGAAEWRRDASSRQHYCNAGREGVAAITQHPINCVTWTQARNFCRLTFGLDLPTAAQLERAAIGIPTGWRNRLGVNLCGDGCPQNPGDVSRPELEDDRFSETAPVGQSSLDVSSFGVRDLLGNVREYVRTARDGAGPAHDLPMLHAPIGATEERMFGVVRSLGWRTDRNDQGDVRRVGDEPHSGFAPDLGFRCAVAVADLARASR